MSNPNAHESYNREVRQDSYQDTNGNTHINVTRTTETVNNSKVEPQDSYQNGYFHGQVTERSHQEEGLIARDNDNAARGLLLGIILTSLAALTAGAVWFYNHNQESTPVTQPVVVPVPKDNPDPKPAATNNQAPKQTTIIEKIKEVPVEKIKEVPVIVPQPQAPSSTPQQNVNVTVPSPAREQSETQPATPVETNPTQPESQNNTTEDTQTNNSSDTTSQSTSGNEAPTTETKSDSGSSE